MGELRAWKSRLTFKIRFQAVFWHELCFQGFPTAWFHVAAVQDSGLMELPLSCFLLEIGFEAFSWKSLPRLTFPVLLFSCLALWPNPPCDSCFILIIEKIRLSPVSGTTVKWGCPSQPLCWNCSAAWIPVLLCIHGSKKKKPDYFDPELWKPRIHFQSWHHVGQLQAVPLDGLFLQRSCYIYVFLIYRLTAITW